MREETPKELAAREAFEDAASRGFPNGDQIRLQTAIYLARTEAEAAATPAVPVGTPPIGSSEPDLSPAEEPLPPETQAGTDEVAPETTPEG
jgi:hypothetical protein